MFLGPPIHPLGYYHYYIVTTVYHFYYYDFIVTTATVVLLYSYDYCIFVYRLLASFSLGSPNLAAEAQLCSRVMTECQTRSDWSEKA